MAESFQTRQQAVAAALRLIHPQLQALVRECECGRFFLKDGKRRFCSSLCAGRSHQAAYIQRQVDAVSHG